MLATGRLSVILLVLAFATACGTRPTTEIDAAKAALDNASASAAQYAPESLKAAQDTNAALDAELAAQDARWIKSYDRARELATSARLASEKAIADATAGKARAEDGRRRGRRQGEGRHGRCVRSWRRRPCAWAAPSAIRRRRRTYLPVYPAVAKSARVGGTVHVEATIGPDGKVADARVVKSVPLLDQAALDAVTQWEYAPTRVRGVAVPVIITVAINFQP